MCREFIHHDALRFDVLHDVETWNADVARQDGIATRGSQQMIDQACRGTLALRPRDANGLIVELAEEEIGLRCDLHPFRVEILQGDARRLDDDVVVIHGLKIACAKILHSLHLVFVGHRNDGLGQVFLQETQRRLALATEAKDQDALTA